MTKFFQDDSRKLFNYIVPSYNILPWTLILYHSIHLSEFLSWFCVFFSFHKKMVKTIMPNVSPWTRQGGKKILFFMSFIIILCYNFCVRFYELLVLHNMIFSIHDWMCEDNLTFRRELYFCSPSIFVIYLYLKLLLQMIIRILTETKIYLTFCFLHFSLTHNLQHFKLLLVSSILNMKTFHNQNALIRILYMSFPFTHQKFFHRFVGQFLIMLVISTNIHTHIQSYFDVTYFVLH